MATTKTPQDNKAAAAEVERLKQERFEDVEGHELLVPFSKVKGSDQARLINRIKVLMNGDDELDTGDLDSLDLDVLADVIDFVAEKFAVDKEAFEDFTCGHGGMSRALNLVMAFVSELGKDED